MAVILGRAPSARSREPIAPLADAIKITRLLQRTIPIGVLRLPKNGSPATRASRSAEDDNRGGWSHLEKRNLSWVQAVVTKTRRNETRMPLGQRVIGEGRRVDHER